MASSAVKVGRYTLGERIAAGGMATVHLGQLDGSAGFSRTVAIKRLHPHLCEDPAFTGAFADEARLAARIRHPNVVPTLDVVRTEGELLIVMEYVDGDSLSSLIRKTGKERIPLPIVVAVISEMLHGLHSAHEAKSETGQPLDIVHRDVSPQNLLVGADGVSRLVDFGIARASAKNRQATTGENDLKGKLAYMAPEQIRREPVTRRTDIYATGIVLWELLTGDRLFNCDNEAATMEKILVGWVQPPRSLVPDLPDVLQDITLRALDPDPNNRFETAREMAVALEDALGRALGREVGAWVERTATETLTTRRALIAKAEQESAPDVARATFTNELVPTTPRQVQYAKPGKPSQMRPTMPDRPSDAGEDEIGDLRTAPHNTGPQMPNPLGPNLLGPMGPNPIVGPLPLGFEYERTVTSFGEELSQGGTPIRRSRTDRIAYGVFGAAVLLTVIVGLSWSKIRGDVPPPPSGAELEEPSAQLIPPPPSATTAVLPPDPTILPPPPPPPSPLSATASHVVAPPPPPAPVRHPVVKPPARQPCVKTTDPATGNVKYKGDCN